MTVRPQQRWHGRLTSAAVGARASSRRVPAYLTVTPQIPASPGLVKPLHWKTEVPNDRAGEGDSCGRVASTALSPESLSAGVVLPRLSPRGKGWGLDSL